MAIPGAQRRPGDVRANARAGLERVARLRCRPVARRLDRRRDPRRRPCRGHRRASREGALGAGPHRRAGRRGARAGPEQGRCATVQDVDRCRPRRPGRHAGAGPRLPHHHARQSDGRRGARLQRGGDDPGSRPRQLPDLVPLRRTPRRHELRGEARGPRLGHRTELRLRGLQRLVGPPREREAGGNADRPARVAAGRHARDPRGEGCAGGEQADERQAQVSDQAVAAEAEAHAAGPQRQGDLRRAGDGGRHLAHDRWQRPRRGRRRQIGQGRDAGFLRLRGGPRAGWSQFVGRPHRRGLQGEALQPGVPLG